MGKLTGRLSGQALIELIIASAVFLTACGAVVSLVLTVRALVVDASQAAQASDYADEGIVIARTIRNLGWSQLTDGPVNNSGAFLGFIPYNSNLGAYNRTITVKSLTADEKLVSSTVTWPETTGRTGTITLSAILTDWADTAPGNIVTGDWRTPIVVGSADIQPSGNTGVDVATSGNRAYLVSSQPSTSKPDFSIFNITDPSNPVPFSTNASMDLGVNNLHQVALGPSSYAYVVNNDTSNQLIAVNAGDPSNPIKTSSQNVNTQVKTLSVASDGQSLLLVGLDNNPNGAELYAYNVSGGNDSNPQLESSLEIGAAINRMVIFNGRAYLATSAPNAPLIIVDVTDPTHMTKLGQLTTADTEPGLSVYVRNEANVYLGRATGGGDELSVVDATNPAAATIIGSANVGSSVGSLVVANHLAFLGTDDANNGLKIYDIGTPTAITRYDTTPLDLPQVVGGLSFDNNHIYAALRSNQALRVIGSSP